MLPVFQWVFVCGCAYICCPTSGFVGLLPRAVVARPPYSRPVILIRVMYYIFNVAGSFARPFLKLGQQRCRTPILG